MRRYSTDGQLLGFWSSSRLGGAVDLAVGADGGVYVAHPPSASVLKFDPAGRLLASLGSRGSGAGQVGKLGSGEGFVRACSWQGHRAVAPSQGRGWADGSEGAGEAAAAAAAKPRGRAQAPARCTLRHLPIPRCVRFPPCHARPAPPRTPRPQFESVSAVSADAENNLFVLDSVLGRASVFTEAGAFLTLFSVTGSDGGQLARPTGLEASQFGEVGPSRDPAGHARTRWGMPASQTGGCKDAADTCHA